MKRLNKVRTTDTKFTRVFNEIIQDKTLSWKARGIFMYLWSMPDDWNFRESEVVRHSSDGMSALRSGLHELEQNNYLMIQYHTNNPKVPVGDSHWYLSDKKMLNCDFRSSKTEAQLSKLDNQNLQTTNKQTTEKQTTKLQNNNNNVADKIINQLQNLGLIFNTIVTDTVKKLTDSYGSKMMLKAIKIEALRNTQPRFLINNIESDLRKGCQTYQPKHKFHNYYGHKPIKQDLPDWAKDDYHVKLHPTSKRQNEKVQKMLKKLNEHRKK